MLSEIAKRAHRPSSALNWLIVCSLFFAITVPLVANVMAWDPDEMRLQRQGILVAYYAIGLVIALTAIFRYGLLRLVSDRYPGYMLLAVLSLYFSVLAGNEKISPMVLMAPIFVLLVFHIFPRIDTKLATGFIIWILIVILTAPVVLFFLPTLFEIPFELYLLSSFRGLSASRTDYGYLTGIAILLVVVRPTLARWIFMPALLTGLVLSESRAALVAMTLSVVYLLMTLRHRNFRLIVWGAVFIACSYAAALYIGSQFFERETGLLESDRTIIYEAALEKAFDSLVWGWGAFYQSVEAGGRTLEPHNAVLQSLLNFGIVPTVFWYLMMATVYFSLKPIGRPFLLYWLIFGLFHPGYDAFLFTYDSFTPLLLAVHFGGEAVASPQPERSPAHAAPGAAHAA